MKWNGFRGRALRLDASDFARVGSMIGVGEDEIRAVLEVESRGSGFDKTGRPAMLFEPHLFWRELGAGAKRDAAAKAGLAYAKWKPGAYPKDSYPRLALAMDIDETAALKSASWGLGQILGSNFKVAGFHSPQTMVKAFMDGEAAQLEAMVNFIKANRLDDDLRRHDWAGFAKGYNGPSYAKHGYHTKLADAYARWAKRPDAKAEQEAPVAPAERVPDAPAPSPQPGPETDYTPAPAKPETAPNGGAFAAFAALVTAAGAALALKWNEFTAWIGGLLP